MTVGGRFGNHIENMKMPINNYFMQKKIKHPSTTVSNIRIYSDNILFHQQNIKIKQLKGPHCLSVCRNQSLTKAFHTADDFSRIAGEGLSPF